MAKKLPKIISQEEFELLLKGVDSVKRISKDRKKRYKLALLLGFEAGMRLSEIVGYTNEAKGVYIPPLSKEQVEVASIRIIQGKGKKDRVVPRPKRMNDNALLLLPLGIERRALQIFTTKLGIKVLNKKISVHTLRHGFGSFLAGQGRPLHEIQMLMGHSRLDTTGVYLHANPKEAIDKAREVF